MALKLYYRSVDASNVRNRFSQMSRVIVRAAAIVFVIVSELNIILVFPWFTVLSLLLSLGTTGGSCLLLYGIFMSSEWTKQRSIVVVVAMGVIWISYLQDVFVWIPYYITEISDHYEFGGTLALGVAEYLQMAKVPLLAILTAILVIDGAENRPWNLKT